MKISNRDFDLDVFAHAVSIFTRSTDMMIDSGGFLGWYDYDNLNEKIVEWSYDFTVAYQTLAVNKYYTVCGYDYSELICEYVDHKIVPYFKHVEEQMSLSKGEC